MFGLWLVGACNWFVSDDMVARAKDRDGDGFEAWQVLGTDCDDADPDVNPEAPEICNDGKDNNCDGVVDDRGVDGVVWYRDADGDGYGDPSDTRNACPDALLGAGWSMSSDDCNDADRTIHPDASDLDCNGIDDDCDGVPDSGGLAYDSDGDGFGVHPDLVGCEDCDDGDPTVFPGAPERCDQRDNNCNSEVDESALPTVGELAFPTIDDAMQGVLAGTGPVVLDLCPGTYEMPGQRVHDKADLTVRGWPNDTDGTVTLVERNANSAFLIAGGRLRLQDVRVSGSRHQAALNLSGSGSLELDSCVVSESQRAIEIRATDQGGATVTLTDTELIDNDAGGGQGGGIYADGGYALTMTRGRISNNAANQGAGLFLTGNRGIANFTGVEISDNAADLGGGLAGIVFGVGQTHGVISLEGVTVVRNTATTAGGGAYVEQFDLVGVGATDSDFADNVSDGSGGGISALRAELRGLDIHDNTAIGVGGGVAFRLDNAPSDSSSRVVDARLSANDGALGCSIVVEQPAQPLVIQNSDITGHSCGAPAVFVSSGSVQSMSTRWTSNQQGNVGAAACPSCEDTPNGVRSFTFP